MDGKHKQTQLFQLHRQPRNYNTCLKEALGCAFSVTFFFKFKDNPSSPSICILSLACRLRTSLHYMEHLFLSQMTSCSVSDRVRPPGGVIMAGMLCSDVTGEVTVPS